MLISPAYAQSAGTAATSGGIASLVSFLPLVLIFVVFYFLMIRPQQKRLKEQQAAIAAVRKGDSVVTAGGIVGKVTKVEEQFVEVEIAANTRIRVVKATLSDVTSPEFEAGQRLMLDFPKWKVWSIWGVLALLCALAVPSLIPESASPAWLARAPRINLGLDLAGGSYLLLEADTQGSGEQPDRIDARQYPGADAQRHAPDRRSATFRRATIN